MKARVNEAPNLSDINFSEELSQFSDPRPGLYLFSGRTGSGKSTAIAAILRSAIEQHDKRIVTVEDPVEFYYPAGARVTPPPSDTSRSPILHPMRATQSLTELTPSQTERKMHGNGPFTEREVDESVALELFEKALELDNGTIGSA